MSPRLNDSAELRRLGRAAPSRSEMELLRAAVLAPPESARAWQRWIAGHEVDDASDRSAGLFAAVSANVPTEALGAEAGRLRGVRRRRWADTQVRLAAAGEALDVLGAAGLDVVVTGGAALLTTISGEPGTRPLGPIDLVLGDETRGDPVPDRTSDAASAEASGTAPIALGVGALESAGWVRVRPVDGPFDHITDLVDPAGHRIRLHRWVLFPRFAGVPERSWVERAVPHEVAGRPVRRFRPADELVATVVLGLLVPSPGLLRWPLDVVDLSRFGPAADDGFWGDVVASAAEFGVGPLVGNAVAMCRSELGAAVPEGVVHELLAGPSDSAARRRWALRRRGLSPERRILRYRRVARESGESATPWGYVRARSAAARSNGLRTAARTRVRRLATFTTDLGRD